MLDRQITVWARNLDELLFNCALFLVEREGGREEILPANLTRYGTLVICGRHMRLRILNNRETSQGILWMSNYLAFLSYSGVNTKYVRVS